MPAGLQVLNDNGILQISELFRNYLLINKVTLGGVWRDDFPNRGYFYDITAPTGSIVACQPAEGLLIGLYTTTVQGSYTQYSFVDTPIAQGAASVCTFYVFSLGVPPTPATYGLEVYDSLGALCFSSNASYMLPIQTWSGRDYTAGMTGIPTIGGDYIIGKVLSTSINRATSAFVFSAPSGYFFTTIFPDELFRYYYDEDVMSCLAGWRSGSLILGDITIGFRSFGPVSFRPPSREYSYKQFSHMVIDVSNY